MKKHYLTLSLPLLAGTASAALPKPNIILILVDDLGFSDIGAYGSEIHTPNIDRLADEGVRFRQFYNNSISAPTRASLLTGQYAHTAGIGYFSVNLGLPAYQGFINRESLTLGEVLRQGGYQTYLSGKWHVGSSVDGSEYPTRRGFDHSFGIAGGASTYLYPHGYADGGTPGPLVADEKIVSFEADSNFYLTDEITRQATGYIRDAGKDKAPFFLYLAYTAPHWPLQAKADDIAPYRGLYHTGWDELRDRRIARQKELGLIPNDFVAAAKDAGIPDWEELTYDEKDLWARKMEVFAAMVGAVDRGVGELLQTLEETGDIDNTLILFISDNGAPAEEVSGQFGIVVNSGPVGTAGSFESQGVEWSHVSNSPLRAYKSFAYEGGISSPFIAWYPSHIPAGKIVDGRGHIIDIAPTFYDIAGVTYPRRFHNTVPHSLPGKSLKEVLYTQEELPERPLFWERAGNRAVLQGNYKLVSIYPSYQWQLYDLENDRGETTDLALLHPGIVDRLSLLYYEWAESHDVVPFDRIRPSVPLLRPTRKQGIQVY
jgi:arylsulfatase